jgi:hypothetical protein
MGRPEGRFPIDASGARMGPNQSLQQTKPPVTVRADARPAPDVFAAEAGVRMISPTNNGGLA